MATLQPNKKKILEIVLFLIELARESDTTITQYEIVKSILIADVFHLRKFGRPVSFDNYAALQFGPVPSEAYDMLKPNYDGSDITDAEWPMWTRSKYPQGGSNAFQFHDPKRAPNMRKLSQTDVVELSEAFKFVKQRGCPGVRDWTHQLPAYRAAWDNRGDRRSVAMNYSLLVEGQDMELVSDLAHASHYM